MKQAFNPKNQDIKIWVNGQVLHRSAPAVNVFDSVVQGGDAVWEGLRLYKEGILHLSAHLNRLYESAHALRFHHIPSKEEIIAALREILTANNMTDGVHIRLTLTRGVKITSGMDPRLNQSTSTLIIVPEYKAPVYDNEKGISLITSSQRRNNPQFLDSKIHHNNLLNNILAKIEANVAGADAALMLDEHGFAAECNGTNIFMIKNGSIFTPYAHNCLPGITRAAILALCHENDVSITEKNISLTELYNADEIFTTGTMGELTPVHTLDGRTINPRNISSDVFQRMVALFKASILRYCESL